MLCRTSQNFKTSLKYIFYITCSCDFIIDSPYKPHYGCYCKADLPKVFAILYIIITYLSKAKKIYLLLHFLRLLPRIVRATSLYTGR